MGLRQKMTAVVACECLILGGCWGGGNVVKNEPFEGPRISDSTIDSRHVLVVQAPTPGWKITIDRTVRRLDDTRVFVTMRRPDPGALYSQVVVTQQVMTDVPGEREILVFARVTDFGQRQNLPPYRAVTLAADAGG